MELSGCDLHDRIIDVRAVLCVCNQQSQVSQAVETTRQTIGSLVKRCQGTSGEEVLSSIGSAQPADNISGRLFLGKGGQNAPRRKAVGQSNGQVEQELRAADQEKRQGQADRSR